MNYDFFLPQIWRISPSLSSEYWDGVNEREYNRRAAPSPSPSPLPSLSLHCSSQLSHLVHSQEISTSESIRWTVGSVRSPGNGSHTELSSWHPQLNRKQRSLSLTHKLLSSSSPFSLCWSLNKYTPFHSLAMLVPICQSPFTNPNDTERMRTVNVPLERGRERRRERKNGLEINTRERWRFGTFLRCHADWTIECHVLEISNGVLRPRVLRTIFVIIRRSHSYLVLDVKIFSNSFANRCTCCKSSQFEKKMRKLMNHTHKHVIHPYQRFIRNFKLHSCPL